MYASSRIIIDNDSDSVDGVVEYVRFIGAKLGLNDKEQYRICYAVEETLHNNILFSFEPDEQQSIEIDVNRIPAGIEVIVHDHGIPRNPFIASPKNLDEIVTDLDFEQIAQKNGDQVSAVTDFILHKLLDRYTHKNLGKGGRSVEMVLYSSEARIEEDCPFGKDSSEPEKERFACIRVPEGGDITGVSRLFYKTYGYSYINDAVYYPERLKELLETGQLTSAIALSDSGRVIGNISLIQPFKGAEILEWGMAVCDPRFRGQGIMSRLIEAITLRAEQPDCQGVFSHSVTNHAFTQKICAAHGFADVALLLGYAGADLSFKKIHPELDQRETTFISFKLLSSKTRAELFLPNCHSAMIKTLYEGIGLEIKRLSRKGEKGSSGARTEITDTIIPSVNIAEVVLKRVGQDAIEQLAGLTRKLCIARVDVIFLFINLEDEAAVGLVEQLELIGYFFGGIFPYYHHQHTLVMQYVNNLRFDYDRIAAHSPVARKLKKYVRGLDPNQNEDQL